MERQTMERIENRTFDELKIGDSASMFRTVIAHGMWGGALISTVLGTELPGPGAIYLGQSLQFRLPVRLGDTITVSVRVVEKNTEKHRVTLDCQAKNQKGEP